jgi:8-oxo-dGTP pyrophosphatase MutT (NUDIX family)
VIKAAGIIFRCRGRVLLLRSSETGLFETPGGELLPGETHQQAAVRETWEETKFRAGHAGKFLCRRVKDGVDYTSFAYDVDDEFVPVLSREHDLYLWARPSDVLPAAKGRPTR